jgi:heterokaryon incompatibility protein Het-C
MANHQVTRVPAGAPAPVLQRYLAGPEGHGGIEEKALSEAGFSQKEAHLVYYGNWLRDLSQLAGPTVNELIRVLATGEFGRTPSDSEIGGYLASEHVDRPEGGESAEDPLATPEQHDQRMKRLSPSQRAWVEEQHTVAFRQMIQQRAAASGLPEWIERGKEHAKRQLREAVRLGRTPDGFRAMGDALHAVEDYFSHSNFIEVALSQLVHEGTLPAADPLVKAMTGYVGVDPANVGKDRKGRPRIVTGTAAPIGNKTVSMWETIKTEINTGSLRKAFVRGVAIRYGWQAAGKAGRVAGGAVGGVAGGTVGALGGGVGGLTTGAGRGAARGWKRARHWWQKPFAAVGGLFAGGATGAYHGVKKGAQKGWRVGSRVGGAAGQAVLGTTGVVVTGVTAGGVAAIASALLLAVDLAIRNRVGSEALKQHLAEQTQISARKPSVGVPLPTHAQIAKDDPDHPLFRPSAELARTADRELGKAIVAAWAGHGPVNTRAAPIEALVDDFVTHPQAAIWWKPVLLDAARSAASAHARQKVPIR